METVNDSGTSYNQVRFENDILELAERILACRVKHGQLLQDPAAAGRLLRMRIGGQEREVFTCIFLDTRHRVLAIEDLFFGSIDGCEVHPREIAKRALLLNASALIVGHCHPSGNSEPSAADRAVTARLKQALALIDIRLLDHFVVVADGEPVSLAARGWV